MAGNDILEGMTEEEKEHRFAEGEILGKFGRMGLETDRNYHQICEAIETGTVRVGTMQPLVYRIAASLNPREVTAFLKAFESAKGFLRLSCDDDGAVDSPEVALEIAYAWFLRMRDPQCSKRVRSELGRIRRGILGAVPMVEEPEDSGPEKGPGYDG